MLRVQRDGVAATPRACHPLRTNTPGAHYCCDHNEDDLHKDVDCEHNADHDEHPHPHLNHHDAVYHIHSDHHDSVEDVDQHSAEAPDRRACRVFIAR